MSSWKLVAYGASVVARKDMRIYYRKAPVFIFGLILPTFLFFAFFVGRQLDISKYWPGFLAMAVFFTSSSVGPLIIPWEKQTGTFERLLTLPVSIPALVLGDAMAGAAFGLIIGALIFIAGIVFLPVSIAAGMLLVLPVVFVLGNLCFSALGVLLSSPAGRVPSNIMMLAALVRFPLIFISSIFIPISELPAAAQMVTFCSPLTYLVDALNSCFGQAAVLPVAADALVLALFALAFIVVSSIVLERKALKGL
jgi:ABC-2 type transport system permease protein